MKMVFWKGCGRSRELRRHFGSRQRVWDGVIRYGSYWGGLQGWWNRAPSGCEQRQGPGWRCV
jgi:hypothetical protein